MVNVLLVMNEVGTTAARRAAGTNAAARALNAKTLKADVNLMLFDDDEEILREGAFKLNGE